MSLSDDVPNYLLGCVIQKRSIISKIGTYQHFAKHLEQCAVLVVVSYQSLRRFYRFSMMKAK